MNRYLIASLLVKGIKEMNANIHEPRSDVIRRHVNNYFRTEKAATEESFADDVKGIYHDRVPNEKDRIIHFHEGGDASKMLVANAQLMFRIIKGAVKFPADIEEAVVLTLPEPYKGDCLAELAGRYGLLAAHVPDISCNESVSNISHLMKETGEAIEKLAPMLADGVIDENDAHLAKDALKEINDVFAELVQLQARITNILPENKGNPLKVVS